MSVWLRDVLNPSIQGQVDPITVLSYDTTNQIVLERSYYNLSPLLTSYVYPGPLITVNGDQAITLARGRQSQPIVVSVS